MKRALIVLVTIFMGLFMFSGAAIQQKYDPEDDIEVIVLMYHNVIPDRMSPNKYEIKASDLKKDFDYIKLKGYSVVTPDELVEYTQGKRQLDKRCVMLTFDDGYYFYNTILQQMLNDYGYKGVISVVGSFTKFNKHTDSTSRYIYMDYDDMLSMKDSGTAHIAAHSYDLHWLDRGRLGVVRKKGEDESSYIKMFDKDCAELENKLAAVNISPICYTYPYGAYCKESEQVVRQRGYKMSLTCNEKVNIITRNPECLYLLGRYNRDGSHGSAEKIIGTKWRL